MDTNVEELRTYGDEHGLLSLEFGVPCLNTNHKKLEQTGKGQSSYMLNFNRISAQFYLFGDCNSLHAR